MKSSKQKPKLYNQFLKSGKKENELIYKSYKNLFETSKANRKEPINLNFLQNIGNLENYKWNH